MNIEKGKTYRIKSESFYLKKKYGEKPWFVLEGTDREVFGGSWGMQNNNMACMMYGIRLGAEGLLPFGGTVYYGKIGMLGELIHESELEEVIYDKKGCVLRK